MTKRFAAIVMIANFAMGLLLYLSTQAMLLHLTATHPYVTLTGVNIEKIFVGAVQPYSSATPLILSAFPNLPFYFLLLTLIINAILIITLIRSSSKAKRLPVVIIFANLMVGFVMYLSSQTMLYSLVGSMNNYLHVTGVNFWLFYVGAVQVGSSPIPLFIVGHPNLSSYVFLLFLIVNIFFTIILLRCQRKT
jgi:hypothetical protein